MNETIKTTAKRKRQNRTILWLVTLLGSSLGLFLLLFAMANDDWILVRFPNFPWSGNPPASLFEARLWAIVVASFFLGNIALLPYTLKLAASRRKLKKKLETMDAELENKKRMLATAHVQR